MIRHGEDTSSEISVTFGDVQLYGTARYNLVCRVDSLQHVQSAQAILSHDMHITSGDGEWQLQVRAGNDIMPLLSPAQRRADAEYFAAFLAERG